MRYDWHPPEGASPVGLLPPFDLPAAAFSPLIVGLARVQPGAKVSSNQSNMRAKASRPAPIWQCAAAPSALVKRNKVFLQVKWLNNSPAWPPKYRSSSASHTRVGQRIFSATPSRRL